MRLKSTSLLRRLLTDQCFSWFSGGGARVVAHTAQTKSIGGAVVAVFVEKGCLDVANIIFGTSTSILTKHYYPG